MPSDFKNAVNFIQKIAEGITPSSEILKWVYNSIENDDIIQIVVNKEKSNDVLKLMLKDGFVLRAMKGV